MRWGGICEERDWGKRKNRDECRPVVDKVKVFYVNA